MLKINSNETDSPSILDQIQQNAQYFFKDTELMNVALTHPSYAMEHNMPLHDYQRLEFLGDAVLQIILSDYLFRQLPDEQEGVLTRLRSVLANEQATAEYTKTIGLDLALLLGHGESLGGGRTRSSILGDIFEAFLGAMYLDGGMEPARALVLRLLPSLDDCMKKLTVDENPKGALQIYCQAHFRMNATYEVVSQTGPNHNPLYVVHAMVNGTLLGTGEGHSRKEADKDAARNALLALAQQPTAPAPDTAVPETSVADTAVPETSVADTAVSENSTPDAPVAASAAASFAPVSKPKTTRNTKLILALDFDGVICDSAAETAASAWHVARSIWPAQFQEPDIPSDMTELFRQSRPYLETGFQSIIMLKILRDGNTPDIFRTDFATRLQAVMDENGLDKPSLVKAFGAERDRWIGSDLEGWLACHGLYPGTIQALGAALKKHKVLILTTKQERFVSAILGKQGIDFPATCIYGLDRKISKETELAALVGAKKTNIHFVEDRIETLLKIKANPVLKRVKLHYAPWGYGTPEQLQQARDDSRIDVLSLDSFAALLS